MQVIHEGCLRTHPPADVLRTWFSASPPLPNGSDCCSTYACCVSARMRRRIARGETRAGSSLSARALVCLMDGCSIVSNCRALPTWPRRTTSRGAGCFRAIRCRVERGEALARRSLSARMMGLAVAKACTGAGARRRGLSSPPISISASWRYCRCTERACERGVRLASCVDDVSSFDGYPVIVEGGGSDAGGGSAGGDAAVLAPGALLPLTMGGGSTTAGGSVLPSLRVASRRKGASRFRGMREPMASLLPCTGAQRAGLECTASSVSSSSAPPLTKNEERDSSSVKADAMKSSRAVRRACPLAFLGA